MVDARHGQPVDAAPLAQPPPHPPLFCSHVSNIFANM
jgi:hypothetical protein